MNDDLGNNNDLDDLEAQLAALGIGGDDDGGDPFASLDFDGDDPFAALEAFGKQPQPAASTPMITLDDLDSLDELNTDDEPLSEEPISAELPADEPMVSLDDLDSFGDLDSLDAFNGFDFGDDESEPIPMMSDDDDGEMDLDKQLEMLLMADKSAGANFKAKDVSSATPTQTVYDPEVDGMGSVQYVKGTYVKDTKQKVKLFANISKGAMIATFIIGVLLISVGAVTAIYAHSAIQGQSGLISTVEHYHPIEIPSGGSVNSVFINERTYVDVQDFTLARMDAGYSGTFFYFEEDFDPDDYYILLYNQARKLYARTAFNISSEPGTGTVLRFAPLSRNTLFLTLLIQHKETNRYTSFNYRLTSPIIHNAPVFINQPIHALGGEPNDYGLVIRYAVLDGASSTIHYSYNPNQFGGLHINPNSDETLVSLFNLPDYSTVNPLAYENAMVHFDEFGISLGSATFGPVFNLESTVEVNLNGLTYTHVNPAVNVTPEQLFNNDQGNPFSIRTGAHTLNLEGMTQQNNNVILTLHGLDENNQRAATDIGITLHIYIDGRYVDIPATEVRISPIGTDVLFNIASHSSELRNVHVSQYALVVDWVRYDVPAVRVPINVSRFYHMLDTRRNEAETAVTEAFIGLLAYKSGEMTSESIVGITPALRNSSLVNNIFAPTEFDGRAMYAASVSTGDLISNHDYIAIVETTWVVGFGRDIQYFSETFQVTARSQDSIWSITEVIKL